MLGAGNFILRHEPCFATLKSQEIDKLQAMVLLHDIGRFYEVLMAEKKQFIETCEKILSQTLEIGYPPSKQSPIASHGTEAQLLRDCLSFASAVYDEKPDVYNFCAGRLFDEYVPTYKEFFKGRFQLQGPAYGGYRFCFSAWCQLLFDAMSGERIFDENHDNLCESIFYLIRPDGEYTRLGNDFNESKGYGSYTQKNPATVPMFFHPSRHNKTYQVNNEKQNFPHLQARTKS